MARKKRSDAKPRSVGTEQTGQPVHARHEPPGEYQVFLSHATYDKWIARVLCEKIEGACEGIMAFRDDRDIAGGERISEAIRNRIRTCDEFVILITPESVTRDWVKIELGMAFMAEVRIIPLLYHVAAEQIPEIIRELRGFPLIDLDQYTAELADRVRRRQK